jgi:hypothetical protein
MGCGDPRRDAMPREYVFRGEGEPFAPNPEEQLATKDPPSDDVVADGTLDEIVGDYQVGGLDSFGAESDRR